MIKMPFEYAHFVRSMHIGKYYNILTDIEKMHNVYYFIL